tara:strand:- start:1173 stop:1991 length:819 start_codon:yes stop_codon:yes gene_type:complete
MARDYINYQEQLKKHKDTLDFIHKHIHKIKLTPEEHKHYKLIKSHHKRTGRVGRREQSFLIRIINRIKNFFRTETPDYQQDKKEVFNINENLFTYDQASGVCKKFNSELATKAQVEEAHTNGANWCNYGWSKDQLALYPIQKEFYDKLQYDPNKRTNCGFPGVNGGYFENKNIKFGVNCYGPKPKPKQEYIQYKKDKEDDDLTPTETVQEPIDYDTLNITPFNTDKWSNTSKHESKYTIIPDESVRGVVIDGRLQTPIYDEKMQGYVSVPIN